MCIGIIAMKLIQTFDRPFSGYWDGGPRRVFSWRIDRSFPDGKSRIGSWDANHYFEVCTGKTEKITLGYAKVHLTTLARKRGMNCTFVYED